MLVIVDDASSAFSYSWTGVNTTSPWVTGSEAQWYNTTTRFPESTATKVGEFTFNFNGTSAAFVGNTPPSSSPQTATVRIDNGTSFVVNYQDPNPQNYMQWFTTPKLSDGTHTIRMSNLSGISIDYATVTVGDQTPLTGQTVIVDDDSPLIQYSGQWIRSKNKFIPGNLPTGFPFANVTHRSSNPGDCFIFEFSGTSINVYGIFSWYNLGSLTAAYTLDGTTYPSSISVTTTTPSYVNKDGEVANFLFFGMDNLSSGNHTLMVNVTQAANQVFILDYLTYTPSFDTLLSMPPLPPLPPLPSSVINTMTVTMTGISASFATVTTSPTIPVGVSASASSPTGAIIGGGIGGVLLGIMVSILVVMLILRQRRADQNDDEDEFSGTSLNDPQIDSSQMQESFSYTHAPPVLGPAKFMQRGWPTSTTSLSVMRSSLSNHSIHLEEGLAHPPSYYEISTRVDR